MLWDVIQHAQIRQLQHSADHRKAEGDRLRDHVRYDLNRIEAKLDALALATQAMWELLGSHTDLTEADIRAKITEIDLRDGVRDGKMGGVPVKCGACGRDVHSRVAHCMYCGHPIEGRPVTQP